MHPDDGRVISNFVIQALCNRDITIYGDGNQTRSFCYVDDLVGGLIRMMETGHEATGPINLGNSQEIKIIDLAKEIVNITNSKARIVFKPLPENDPVRRQPDVTYARKLLGWQAGIDLKDGLERTIQYFSELLDKAD
jgi:UDP-glucuronate decarboxylase